MVWGYIQYGGVREICRVEGNINSLKYQSRLSCLLHSQPKKGPNFAAGWCSIAYFHLYIKVPQGEEDQGAPGLASPVTRHEHHWACLGVGWKRKHGRWNQRILMNSGRHAKLLSLLFLMTSSIIVWILAEPHGCSPSSSWKSYKIFNLDLTSTTT